MLRKASRHSIAETRLSCRFAGERREPVAAQRVARERPAEVDAAVGAARVECVRALDVLFGEVLVVLRWERCRGRGRTTMRPSSIAYVALLGQRNELTGNLAFGEVEARRPAHRLERRFACALERIDERAQLRARRRAIEAADAHVDRMDLATADQREDLVARLLQREPALDLALDARAPSGRRRRSRGSREREACRRGARGSRSTRRSRGVAAADGSAQGSRRRTHLPSR